MAIFGLTGASVRATWILRGVGICVFVTAFFLPACTVEVAEKGDVLCTGCSDFVVGVAPKGWNCAEVALLATPAMLKLKQFDPDLKKFLDLPLALSGWVNPLILLFLAFGFTRRFATLRRVLAVGVLLCLGATWFFFGVSHISPLVGHYLWVAGALLILASDF
jgi:hypothetical protein